MKHELAAHALSGKNPEAPKMKKAMHMEELDSGGYQVTKHHADGKQTKHGAKSLNAMKTHMMEHFGPEEAEDGPEDTTEGE